MFKQYDHVRLNDGLVGYLIEDFGDAFLFEYPTPGCERRYDDKIIFADEIDAVVPFGVEPNPYADKWDWR